MHPFFEIVISLCIVVGALFTLVGSFALVKLPHLMARIHGPAKATTLGVGALLVASMFHSGISVQEVLITGFLFITAPVTAHFVSKAYLHREVKPSELPKPDGPYGWSTYTSAADVQRVFEEKDAVV